MSKGEFFEAAGLPDEQKMDLCKALLGEFGVTQILARSNGELIHSCCLPFRGHKNGDRNPSASLNYKRLTYNCLGCGNSGGLLWFIANCRGVSSQDAREWLQGTAGLGGSVMDVSDLLAYLDALYAPDSDLPAPIPVMSPKILDPWMLIHPYMTEVRGIPEQTLVEFRVGFAPEYVVKQKPLLTAPRIIIPQFWDGDLVGWQARRLSPSDPEEAKYKNSPDFPKDVTIYNYDRRASLAVVVESPMSVLSKHHTGRHYEATFGAKVTDRQVRLLQRHEQVILWFDNDNAGWKATQAVGEALAPYNIVWVVDSPWAADPADLTDDEAERLIEEAIPFAEWSPPTTLMPWEPREVTTA